MDLKEMKELANAEPKNLDFQEDQKLVIANPNPEILYKDTWQGKDYEFPPFLKVRVDKQLGYDLVLRAQETKQMLEANRDNDIQQWAHLTDQKSEAIAFQAKKFGEKRPDGSVWTKTRPLRWPGLVDMTTPAGQAIYKEALEWRESVSEKDLAEYREYYADKLYEPTDSPQGTLEKVEKSLEKEEEEAPLLNVLNLLVPNENWERERKVEYIEDMTKAPVAPQMKGREDYLNREMWKAYNTKKQAWDSAKVKYNEVSSPA